MPGFLLPVIQAPSDWVVRHGGRVAAGGEVLDVACGSGRHGRWFLEQGHSVVLLDRDTEGVQDLAEHPAAEILEADLEDGSPWPLAGRQFAAVVVTNYLYRPLFPNLLDAVAPGGVLIYETFAVGNERFGRPSNPDYLLRDGELAGVVSGRLDVIAFETVEVSRPRPAVVQRLAAIMPAES